MNISENINAQVKSIVADVEGLLDTLRKVDVADLQKQAQGLTQTAVVTATTAYADLVKKSEELLAKAKGLKVDDIKKTVDDNVEDYSKQARGFADDAQKRAESAFADAKATVTKVTGKRTTARKTTAKKAPATKTAAKKTAAKTAPAKTAPAKTAPAKKTAAKKAPAKKTAAKKTAAKKTPAAKKA